MERYKKQNRCIRVLQHLPEDLLYLIFEKLDEKKNRDSFGLTCNRFLNIQNTTRKYLELALLPCSIHPISDPITFILDKLLNRFTQLQSLSLTSYNVTNVGLNLVVRYQSL